MTQVNKLELSGINVRLNKRVKVDGPLSSVCDILIIYNADKLLPIL